MAMKGNTRCAVPECNNPISGYNNLCDEHRLPGMAVTEDESTMVITIWYAEHGDEVGTVVLNDWALGNLFGGRVGFEVKLAEQGFVSVRNLATPLELQNARRPSKGKKLGKWSGPWLTQYEWEVEIPKGPE
ncbi:MAG TPA: hypothetical protein VN310_15480 [Candidatus Dormibacteraeota bacterium]|nr:hypothetical protein [Candidatus Dormibacteraeota bacterium]